MDGISCTWSHSALNSYNQVIGYPRKVLFDDKDFICESTILQPVPGILMTCVHLTVHRWTPSVFKRLKHLWSSNRHLLPPIVYAGGDVCDAKWIKFVSRLGFEQLIDSAGCSDGVHRPIFTHFRK